MIEALADHDSAAALRVLEQSRERGSPARRAPGRSHRLRPRCPRFVGRGRIDVAGDLAAAASALQDDRRALAARFDVVGAADPGRMPQPHARQLTRATPGRAGHRARCAVGKPGVDRRPGRAARSTGIGRRLCAGRSPRSREETRSRASRLPRRSQPEHLFPNPRALAPTPRQRERRSLRHHPFRDPRTSLPSRRKGAGGRRRRHPSQRAPTPASRPRYLLRRKRSFRLPRRPMENPLRPAARRSARPIPLLPLPPSPRLPRRRQRPRNRSRARRRPTPSEPGRPGPRATISSPWIWRRLARFGPR